MPPPTPPRASLVPLSICMQEQMRLRSDIRATSNWRLLWRNLQTVPSPDELFFSQSRAAKRACEERFIAR